MARYCPLFSGSSGNCTYVGTANGGVLVDAGVSAKRIETALREREIDPASVRAVLVTHEHRDHVAGLRVLLKRFHYPVYASRGTWQSLLEDGILGEGDLGAMLEPGECEIADMRVKAFHTSHDCAESMGFCFQTPDDRRIAVATDMGMMTEEVREALTGCDLIHLESNHVVRMLECGPYPYPLKRRILSEKGHLSNEDCAQELQGFARKGTSRFVLAHLSRENNTPELAYLTARTALCGDGLREGTDFLLKVASPQGGCEMVVF